MLLLADEPTGALDTHSAKEVINIFNELHNSGITIIIVTHSYEVACFSERIILVSDGCVLQDNIIPTEAFNLRAL
jgi:putative ABC transport system ATP-binding protein